jgi:hypothetical protein
MSRNVDYVPRRRAQPARWQVDARAKPKTVQSSVGEHWMQNYGR